MQFVDVPVFVQRQVPRVQVLQNWGSAAAHFRSTRVRVLHGGVQFVINADVGPVEQLQAFVFQKGQKTVGVRVAVLSQLSTSRW